MALPRSTYILYILLSIPSVLSKASCLLHPVYSIFCTVNRICTTSCFCTTPSTFCSDSSNYCTTIPTLCTATTTFSTATGIFCTVTSTFCAAICPFCHLHFVILSVFSMQQLTISTNHLFFSGAVRFSIYICLLYFYHSSPRHRA
jgi:hypothetical protein